MKESEEQRGKRLVGILEIVTIIVSILFSLFSFINSLLALVVWHSLFGIIVWVLLSAISGMIAFSISVARSEKGDQNE